MVERTDDREQQGNMPPAKEEIAQILRGLDYDGRMAWLLRWEAGGKIARAEHRRLSAIERNAQRNETAGKNKKNLAPHDWVSHKFRDGAFLRLGDGQFNSFPVSVQRLITCYRSHIEAWGDDSIAHLCFDYLTFSGLTEGVYLHRGEDFIKVPINTISQLREVLEESSDGRLRRSNPTESMYMYGYFRTERLVARLAEWDTFREVKPASGD